MTVEDGLVEIDDSRLAFPKTRAWLITSTFDRREWVVHRSTWKEAVDVVRRSIETYARNPTCGTNVIRNYEVLLTVIKYHRPPPTIFVVDAGTCDHWKLPSSMSGQYVDGAVYAGGKK